MALIPESFYNFPEGFQLEIDPRQISSRAGEDNGRPRMTIAFSQRATAKDQEGLEGRQTTAGSRKDAPPRRRV